MDCHYNDCASRIEDNRRENSYHHYQFKSAGQTQTARVFLPKVRLTPRVNISSNVQKIDIRSFTDSSGLTHPNTEFLKKRNRNHPKRAVFCVEYRNKALEMLAGQTGYPPSELETNALK
ncbi:hypothetical protein X801_05688 [Opisthorchis viverrini]|uniref:Uncharacterized protein n=1 Tax=Opisthorchis viverrini TaxID=6198 RepID=A0A1S8WVD0_OPIVI|nr:hypothetical protein X801_05688 [Opisthorchis viverrini]